MPEMQTLPYDADKIRDLRERAGLSLIELGVRTDRHPESLRNIERNRKNASRLMLACIAKALGADLDDIVLEDEVVEQPMKAAS
ncbi:hypothetical protein BJF79_15455 [Actinomadura sp. CNU-125]|uniref:helix-turn-helix domain-containing protein n=1 Tax=Actinomadura sp. CNU-125 TaxID=1904961 RepID=UPI00095E366F|nr:helix-turn-helix transcriptional regulator [Actinomadura sp. CNU-125]OLT21661.1 hypothetical protein BJF79_15455 [Actinomadura sp. CNU-125]